MVTFSPRKQQDPSFDLDLAKLSSLVADMQALQRGRMPEELAGDEVPLLDRWIFGSRLAPCLKGLASGHPRLIGEDRAIYTSELWLLSEDRSWARTLSRWYRLGRRADFPGFDS